MKNKRDSIFKELEDIKTTLDKGSIKELFSSNPKRFEEFNISFGDMIFDFSKLNLDNQVLEKLIQLVKVCDVEEKRDAMFGGEKINITENRAVLHTALRNKKEKAVFVDGKDVMPDIAKELDKIKAFS